MHDTAPRLVTASAMLGHHWIIIGHRDAQWTRDLGTWWLTWAWGHASLRIVGRHCRYWLQFQRIFANFSWIILAIFKIQGGQFTNIFRRRLGVHELQTLLDSWRRKGLVSNCIPVATTKTCVRDGGVADAELKRVTAAAWAITSSNEWTPPNVLNYYSTLMASAKSLQSVLQVDYP